MNEPLQHLYLFKRRVSLSVSLIFILGLQLIQFSLLIISPVVGLIFLVLSTLCLVLGATNANVLLVYTILSIISQNIFISLGSSFINNQLHFKTLLATNFVLPPIIALGLLVRNNFHITNNKLFRYTGVLILLLFASLFHGITNGSDFGSAIVNFRLFTGPIFMLLAGYLIASRCSKLVFKKVLQSTLILVVLVGLFEIIAPETFYSAINAAKYYSYKYPSEQGYYSFISAQDVLKKNQARFLNFYYDIVIIRSGSILLNTIGFAYIIIILSVYLFQLYRKVYILILAWFLVIFLTSAKGPLVAITIIMFVYLITVRTKVSFGIFLIIISILCFIVVYVGFLYHNEHILGFLNGLKNMVSNLTGKGLGSAGNLITNRTENFEDGRESAFGVLFTSVGIFSLIYIYLMLKIMSFMKTTQYYILSTLSIIIFFQGIFQEEAFSPYALGITLFISGFHYGKIHSTHEI